jgi:hypothetical protein
MATPFLLLTVAAVCGLLASGCGGDGGGKAAQSDRTAAASGGPEASEAPSGAARDACGLIPAEQVGGFAKDTVTTRSEPGQTRSVCTYLDKSGVFPYLRVTVYWKGGKEQFEAVQTGTRIAGKLLAAPGDKGSVDEVVTPGPVAGLGDAAFYHGIAPSYVLSGDVLLMFEMQMADQRRAFRPLASTALSRL